MPARKCGPLKGGLLQSLCFPGLGCRDSILTMIWHISVLRVYPTEWLHWFHYIAGQFLEGGINTLPDHYESVLVITRSSSGEGPGEKGFPQEVYQRLRGPPFHSSISAEEQVWDRVSLHTSLPSLFWGYLVLALIFSLLLLLFFTHLLPPTPTLAILFPTYFLSSTAEINSTVLWSLHPRTTEEDRSYWVIEWLLESEIWASS